MENCSILYSLIFLILIKEIINNNIIDIYQDCEEGKYGLNCEKNCTCDKWSSSRNCSRIEGRCLDCKFGQFDINCDDICDPKCKTNLCCSVLSSKYEKSNKNIKTNITTLNIKFNNKVLNILADYNVGYPLTIFNKTLNESISFENEDYEEKNYNYSNYKVTGKLFENKTIYFINGINTLLDISLSILIDDNIIPDDPEINGVIGLGFYNSINMKLFTSGKIKLNIASYEVDNKRININFGSLYSKQKKYVHKLSYCKALSDENKHLRMKCKVNGMRAKKYSDALALDDTEIQFTLSTETSFILKNEYKYTHYIKEYYFDDENYQTVPDQNSTIFCFKESEINRLSDFGFVINNYYYSYQADELFIKDNICPKKYLKFRMQFKNNTKNIIVIGKNFFNDMQFSIDNEEKKIYFYSDNSEYFSGDIVDNFSSKPNLTSDPFVTSFIVVGIVIFLNIVSFLIYFYFKRKKKKLN
jgi:hypothetical protein